MAPAVRAFTKPTKDFIRNHSLTLENGDPNWPVVERNGVYLGLIGLAHWNPLKLPYMGVWFAVALFRYIDFYRDIDPTASVAAAVYWASVYYLSGPKNLIYSLLFDYTAGLGYVYANTEGQESA